MPARLLIDTDAIRHNASEVVRICSERGIEVTGVTKGACGHPAVARAFVEGGVKTLADSRVAHMRRMRDAGINVPIMMLRLPSIAEADEVVTLAQSSLNSELATIRALSDAALGHSVTHDVILMVEVGDRREGVMPEDLEQTVGEILRLPGVRLAGLGSNVNCVSGVMATPENTAMLVEMAGWVGERFGVGLQIVSGGHTSSIRLVQLGDMPGGVNHLRVGEAILIGEDSSGYNWEFPMLRQETFILEASIIELKHKPSMPEGEIGLDAFGRKPVFVDRGVRLRAILDVGEQDLQIGKLTPMHDGVQVIAASSDHLVADLTDMDASPAVGDRLRFRAAYAAMATGMASSFLPKVTLKEAREVKEAAAL